MDGNKMDGSASPWERYQSRYVAYCRAHGASSPDEMRARDEAEWPGRAMAGYILWISHKWSEFRKALGPDARDDHGTFDAWLDHQAALAAAPEPEGGRT